MQQINKLQHCIPMYAARGRFLHPLTSGPISCSLHAVGLSAFLHGSALGKLLVGSQQSHGCKKAEVSQQHLAISQNRTVRELSTHNRILGSK